MATAKLKTGEMIEMPEEELLEMIMSDSDKLDTFQSETPRQTRRSKQREAVSAVQNNV